MNLLDFDFGIDYTEIIKRMKRVKKYLFVRIGT